MKRALHARYLRLLKLSIAPLFGLVLSLPCSGQFAAAQASNSVAIPPEKVREPAVAGLFYPKDASALTRELDRYLADAPTNALPGVRALICPHAGYEYSGPVAARAYRQIAGRDYNSVIILAPSHYALFTGVSVPAAEAYRTPLGIVPISPGARQLANRSPFVLEPKCLVHRPGWADVASKQAAPDGENTPETWEHSVEVQVPFLQRTLTQFAILPVVFGRADPEEVAKQLASIVDDKTLVIASSDLSHYHSYSEARELDRQTLQWVCNFDFAHLTPSPAQDRACGRMPILTLLHLAKVKGWTPQLLDYRNSGDTSGTKSRVVGYGAVAFVSGATEPSKPGAAANTNGQFSEADRKFLLDLARNSVGRATRGEPPPEVDADAVPLRCRSEKGCFVTLNRNGALRGCIGNILPKLPLYAAVVENARSAAIRDPRFPPVTAEEAAGLDVEVSVLTVPEPLAFSSPEDLLTKLQPGRDGVVLRIGEHGATFLPQVWKQLPDKTEFLGRLSLKAGCASAAWRGKDVSVSVYHAEAFH